MYDWVGTYSTVEATNAGLDLEMPGPTKFRGPKLLEAVKEDKVDEATVDFSARRVLELIIKTRRFDDPDDKIEFYAENPERDEFIAKAAAEAAVLLKNNGNLLPILKDATIAVIGQHAHVPTVGGGGSAKVDAGRLISLLEGPKIAGVNFTYEPGVPVFGALPLPGSARVSPTGSKVEDTAKPIKLEWFNSSKIGQNLVRECYIERTEYMIKERWPSDLNAEYSTRMAFNLTPKTSGNHMFSVLATATLYIDNKEVFHRPQEQHLQREASSDASTSP
jgi:beta-glucosidase